MNLDGVVGAAGAMVAAIVGVVKWVGRDLVKAIDRNTLALHDNTLARKDSNKLKTGTGPAVTLAIMLLALCLGGCVAPDAMGLRAVQRDRQIWAEDCRADLNPELVKSRNAEFDAHERYFRGSKADAVKLAEGPTR